eukprot:TRINITY_DN59593_c0_g2_i1.p1 TRINITY_DN59593_c0_g2~~TRINITY_DN59593_c0_g2_i1.p1  ORF type:complete len:507 (-),score=91.08 TRINITY_DN59593_c0_g2_i1:16-1536(-)
MHDLWFLIVIGWCGVVLSVSPSASSAGAEQEASEDFLPGASGDGRRLLRREGPRNGEDRASAAADRQPELSDEEHQTRVQKCARSLRLATVSTKHKESTLEVPGVPGWTLTNLGVGQRWNGSGATKPPLYERWLQRLDNDTFAVLIDDDVASGGCSRQELCANYFEVVDATGGPKAVVSAELGLFPNEDPKTVKQYKKMRPKVFDTLNKLHLHTNLYEKYLDCSQRPSPPCRFGHIYQFVNSGFLMGPVGELKELLHEARKRIAWNDQWLITMVYFQDPERVAVDYGGILSLSTHGLNLTRLVQIEDRTAYNLERPTPWQPAPSNVSIARLGAPALNNVAKNTATGRVQCFMHLNGKPKAQLPPEWRLDPRLPSPRLHTKAKRPQQKELRALNVAKTKKRKNQVLHGRKSHKRSGQRRHAPPGQDTASDERRYGEKSHYHSPAAHRHVNVRQRGDDEEEHAWSGSKKTLGKVKTHHVRIVLPAGNDRESKRPGDETHAGDEQVANA